MIVPSFNIRPIPNCNHFNITVRYIYHRGYRNTVLLIPLLKKVLFSNFSPTFTAITPNGRGRPINIHTWKEIKKYIRIHEENVENTRLSIDSYTSALMWGTQRQRFLAVAIGRCWSAGSQWEGYCREKH